MSLEYLSVFGDHSPDVWNIVELRNHIMKQFWSRKTVVCLDLGTKVSEDHDSWHFRSDQDGPHQQLEMGQPFRVVRIGGVEFEYHEIGRIRQVMRCTVGIVRRVGFAHSSVGKFVGGVREDRVPPVEEF